MGGGDTEEVGTVIPESSPGTVKNYPDNCFGR